VVSPTVSFAPSNGAWTCAFAISRVMLRIGDAAHRL
jgi:hypothetical protein